MFHSLRQHPLGAPIPDSPHAVSCSLPSMESVIAYEEKDAAVRARLQTGYPRFVEHPYLQSLAAHFKKHHSLEGRAVFLVRSADIPVWFRELMQGSGEKVASQLRSLEAFAEDSFFVLHCDSSLSEHVQKFLQHVGGSISSREAEDALGRRGLFSEPPLKESPILSFETQNPLPVAQAPEAEKIIREILAEKHGTPDSSDILLGNSGMSCFYAAFRSLQMLQAKAGRHVWIQLGWLYLDTIELLKKCTGPDHYVYFPDVADATALVSFIQKNADRIAGIVTESPTNPLVQMPDIESLYRLASEHGIALLLDPTIASPHNIRCLEYSDVVVNSLTKYAASEGDIMMGSLALNQNSRFFSVLQKEIPRFLAPPYKRDVERMAQEIQNYDAVVEKMNANNLALLAFLKGHPRIGKVHHALTADSREHFERVQKAKGGPGCMLSVEIDGSMQKFYDAIQMAKGPSFGMKYSLLCPFIYLAHYDLVQSKEGRVILQQNGLNPDLIRISVGTEPIEAICDSFAEALQYV